MNILHIIPSLNPAMGGTVEVINHLSYALMARGYQVETLCLDSPDALWLDCFPFKVYALGHSLFEYRYCQYLLPWLHQNAHQYDYIIVHGLWQYPSFATWLALHNTNIPYFVYPHGMLDPWFKKTYPLKHLKKWLYWPWADYRVLRDAAGILFTSEEECSLARQSFWLYQGTEYVVNLGICAPPIDQQEQTQIFFENFPDLVGKRILLFLGRMHPKKGCDLLIEAFARVAQHDQNLHLVMAGPDQSGWQHQLEHQAQTLGIGERVSWLGLLSGDLKWGAFRAAEVFILPSHQENFGVAVVESLACATPVIISHKVNIWREIERDQAGLVVQDNLDSLVTGLEQWLTLSTVSLHTMQQNTQTCFAQRFEIQQTVEQLLDVLQNSPQQSI